MIKKNANSTQDLIKIECHKIEELLLEKNREYGDSALHPLGVFSKLSAIEAIKIRIDDKLSRIQYSGQKNIKEDTVLDLIGYLILMRVCNDSGSKDEEYSLTAGWNKIVSNYKIPTGEGGL